MWLNIAEIDWLVEKSGRAAVGLAPTSAEEANFKQSCDGIFKKMLWLKFAIERKAPQDNVRDGYIESNLTVPEMLTSEWIANNFGNSMFGRKIRNELERLKAADLAQLNKVRDQANNQIAESYVREMEATRQQIIQEAHQGALAYVKQNAGTIRAVSRIPALFAALLFLAVIVGLSFLAFAISPVAGWIWIVLIGMVYGYYFLKQFGDNKS
jgi:hypothetical protein